MKNGLGNHRTHALRASRSRSFLVLLSAVTILSLRTQASATDEPCIPVPPRHGHVRPSSSPVRTIAVILVELPGIPNPYTPDDVVTTLTQRQPGSPFSAFEVYAESSHDKYQLTFGRKTGGAPAIFGPYLVDRASREKCTSKYLQWSTNAEALALANGYRRKRFDHTVFIFPPRTSLPCTVTGIGELLGDTTWLFGLEISSFTHELGHNLGLFHSGRRDKRGVLGQYGDLSSPMGAFQPEAPLFSAPNLAQLGWLTAGERETIVRGTTARRSVYAIDRERDETHRRVIEIALPDKSSYLLSFRQELPVAPSSRSRSYVQGLTIHRNFGLGRSTVLMGVLRDGVSFIDERNNIRITQFAHTALNVTVDITNAPRNGAHPAGCFIVDPCTVPTEGRTPKVSDCRGFAAPYLLGEFVTSPRCPTRSPGEDFDDDGESDSTIDEADGDGDGVPNAEDCAPTSSSDFRFYRYTDTDKDGRYETLLSAENGVCDSNAPPANYLSASLVDTCPSVSDPLHVDNDRDGVGDLCQLDPPSLASYRRLLPHFQLLRRAGKTLQKVSSKKRLSALLARSTARAINLTIRSYGTEDALVPLVSKLRRIQNNLENEGSERTEGRALEKALDNALI